MRRVIGMAVALLALLATASNAQTTPELLLFGGDGHKEFLGCLNCSDTAANSVWNDVSKYGWANDFGVWNPFKPYKNEFGQYSACNEFASDPPVIVDRRGNFYGRLTISEYKEGSVCGVRGSEQLCRALKVMCAAD